MNKIKYKITVLGAGNMGTALAQIIAQNGFRVKLWNYEGDLLPLEQISKFGENKKYLPKIKLSNLIEPEADLASVLQDTHVVFFVIPSFYLKKIISRAVKFLLKDAVCVDVSKGLVKNKVAVDVFNELLSINNRKKLVSISGPAIASQIALGSFTVMNVAGQDITSVKLVKHILENQQLKLVLNNDLVGLELAGSLKNVYAILYGICDGLKQTENTKAVIFTLVLREMNKIIVSSHGQCATAYDFCGLGDLLATVLSKSSRNRRFGQYLGQGLSAEQSLKKVKQTVEGYYAVQELLTLACKLKLKLPIAKNIQKIINGQISPQKGLQNVLASIK